MQTRGSARMCQGTFFVNIQERSLSMSIRRLFGSLNTAIIMLLMTGGILFGLDAKDFVISLKPAVSFEDMLDGKEVKVGSHVEGNVVYCLDYFASESSYTRYKDGSRSGDRASGNFYLLPTANGYIGLKSRQADVAALDQLTEETFAMLDGGAEPTTEIFIEGSVVPMEDKVEQYYKEYLAEIGYTEAEIAGFGDALMIANRSFVAVRVMFAIGVVALLLGILLWIRGYKEY